MKKLALVTGASSGIGRETVVALAKTGQWRIVAMARREEKLNALAAELGDAVVPYACDGGDGEAVLAMAKSILAEHGTPDAIVNNAGAGSWVDIEDTPPSDIKMMMDAPFFSAFHITHAFLPAMLERDSGVLIQVNSPACLTPWAGATGYTCSRWALRGLHEALCQDLAGTGVQSCHVVLGEVSTDYFDKNAVGRERVPGISRFFRVVTPEACASVIVKTIQKPSRQVFHPMEFAAHYYAFLAAPWATRLMIRKTQRTR